METCQPTARCHDVPRPTLYRLTRALDLVGMGGGLLGLGAFGVREVWGEVRGEALAWRARRALACETPMPAVLGRYHQPAMQTCLPAAGMAAAHRARGRACAALGARACVRL